MKQTERRSILIGLIGAGIGGSLSPAMHEREGAKQGMTYIYRMVDLDELHLDQADLPDLLLAAERMGFTGLNITHPCKQAVVALLDELSDAATKIGAVNTVVFSAGRRIGHNTDAWGFVESFSEEIADTHPCNRILLLGAGGAGTAIAHGLLTRYDCQLDIVESDPGRAREVRGRLEDVYGPGRVTLSENVAESIANADGVINATPVGMALHPGCPIDVGLLRPGRWVADIIYFPLDTVLVKAARKAGCTVMTGGGMAVYQAVRAFERFTGVRPDVQRMKAHFNSLVQTSDPRTEKVREVSI